MFGAAPAPDPAAIVRKSVELDQANWRKAKDYTYFEREEERHAGKASSKTYEVTTLYGHEFRRQTARDDKPLPAAGAAREQQRWDNAIAARAAESPEKRAKQDADAAREREKDRAFAREIPDAFNFVLAGEESIEGHDTWVISATPRDGYVPRDSRAKALTKIRGTVWIEKNGYVWVKAEVEVLKPFHWGLFVASLNPGTVMEFLQTRVNGDVWMPKRITLHLDARFLVKKFQGEYDATFSGYRRFSSDSKLVSPEEAGATP